MKSTINWINTAKGIVLVDSIGLWNPSELLDGVQSLLTDNPKYIIWNPSNIMFPAEALKSYKESTIARQSVLDLIVESLLEGSLNLLIIIQKKDLESFNVIATAYQESGAGHLVKFAESVENASKIIEKHQVLSDDLP